MTNAFILRTLITIISFFVYM